ncbi:iron chelate uptake ABC transporter family permease subunit [Salmonella enterica subsp. enterica serovar Weltevreden]|nr:iron chelate uptake ABC transporter family permease subunit [Salmonella enterica subsp. enterica serovar Weltevreden]
MVKRGELFVWQIRLPRTLAVLLVGAALALSGAVMQALFENPTC